MQLEFAELEEFARFFEGRLQLLPQQDTDESGSDDDARNAISPQQRREKRKRKEQRRRKAYRDSFKPFTARTNTPASTTSPGEPVQRVDAEGLEVEGDVVVGGDAVGREALKKRLEEKIAGIRAKTGSAKRKEKSTHEKKTAQNARKQKRARRKLALQKRRHLEETSPAKPPAKKLKMDDSQAETPETITFSEVKETEGAKSGGVRKRKLSEKFRQLSVTQKQKASQHEFTQTGQGGERVLQTEWDRAFVRVSGKKVLDDPKRIQKSIDDRFKRKVKSAKKWEERRGQEVEEKQKRQEKRSRNLERRTEERRKKKEQRNAKKRGSHL